MSTDAVPAVASVKHTFTSDVNAFSNFGVNDDMSWLEVKGKISNPLLP